MCSVCVPKGIFKRKHCKVKGIMRTAPFLLLALLLAAMAYGLQPLAGHGGQCAASGPAPECRGALNVSGSGIQFDYLRIGALAGLLSLSAYLLAKRKLKYRTHMLVASVVLLGFLLPTCTCDFVMVQTMFSMLLGKTALLGGLSLLVLFAIISAFTLVFGRFYCGWVCPLGAVQELANRITKKELISDEWKRKLSWARPFVLIASLVSVVFGVYFIGPTINWYKYGHIAVAGLTVGLVLASLFTYRPWCEYVCPFGYFLSLLHRIAPMRVRLSGTCKGCNMCGKTCNSAAIEKGRVDGALCIECGNCISSCPAGVLGYNRNK